ncbi:hypothetical protein N752_08555 [Desulforamulus aquiferis]|nr:hypothetical protein N752_08555 [Desulforamulus aquiferis]
MEEYLRSRVPWSTEPSLETKAKEVGINFDALIDGIKMINQMSKWVKNLV